MRPEIRDIQQLMEAAEYVTDAPVATSVHLALALEKPLLIEGHAGVGKTEVAKVLAAALRTPLIRLQCYEGLDISHAVYEWNYSRQLLEIRLLETAEALDRTSAARELFTEAFLVKRPLLRAITRREGPPVLLIDEAVAAGQAALRQGPWAKSTPGERARGATLYSTLEPCSHTGRTGPCTDRIIAAGIKRVVAAMEDPFPAVSGRGLAILRQHGIVVDTGIGMTKESKRHYPNGNLAAHVLGFVGIDNQGLDGIELAFENDLKGVAGRIVLEKDPSGTRLPNGVQNIMPSQDG